MEWFEVGQTATSQISDVTVRPLSGNRYRLIIRGPHHRDPIKLGPIVKKAQLESVRARHFAQLHGHRAKPKTKKPKLFDVAAAYSQEKLGCPGCKARHYIDWLRSSGKINCTCGATITWRRPS